MYGGSLVGSTLVHLAACSGTVEAEEAEGGGEGGRRGEKRREEKRREEKRIIPEW